MERKILGEITHNAQVKKYPDGTASLMVADRAIFREPGWESDRKIERAARSSQRQGSAEDLERARRRARSKVSDYARSNDFKYFVTLTLDAGVVDRYDISAVMRPLRVFLDNAVRRKGLKYVLVPELHKDGAIHFHGLMNDAFTLVDSGTIKMPGDKKPRRPRSKAQRADWLASDGQIVYNIPDYKIGFSTAIPLHGERARAIAYVCKYIGKDSQKVGGRWFYSGGDLLTPGIEYLDMDYESMRGGEHSFTIPRLGCECIKIEIEV